MNRKSVAVLVSSVIMVSFGCKLIKKADMKAEPEYLEAKDWFRDGKDRFYLAYGTSNEKIGTGPEVYGNHSLFGIGCFSEPADIKKHPHLLRRAQVSITHPARSDFKIIDKDATPAPGDCKILFRGAPVDTFKNANYTAARAALRTRVALAGFDCTKFAISASAVAICWFGGLGGAAASGGASVWAAKAITAPLLVGAFLDFGKCGAGIHRSNVDGRRYIKSANQDKVIQMVTAAWHEAVKKAESTRSTAYNGTVADRLRALVARGTDSDELKAVAVINMLVVKQFNSHLSQPVVVTGDNGTKRKVDPYFEQGWFSGNRFFDDLLVIQHAGNDILQTIHNKWADE